jgi:hypothetical protein
MDDQVRERATLQSQLQEMPIQSNTVVGNKLKTTNPTCMQDLYDFVFQEEEPSDFYGQKITGKPLDANMRLSCDNSDVFTTKKPVCDVTNEIQSLFEQNKKEKTSMNGSVEGNSSFTVVNKYKKEDTDGIKGYDAMESEYSLL